MRTGERKSKKEEKLKLGYSLKLVTAVVHGSDPVGALRNHIACTSKQSIRGTKERSIGLPAPMGNVSSIPSHSQAVHVKFPLQHWRNPQAVTKGSQEQPR